MAQISLAIQNHTGHILATANDEAAVVLVFEETYQPGDAVILEVSEPNTYYLIQLEDSMAPAFVYMKETTYRLNIPFNEQKLSYNPKSFTGNRHYLTARTATTEEIAAYKNLALNVYDCHENDSCFPHAHANVETRGEATFAARNAIDGVIANRSHGDYPYQSWGINQNPDAEWTLDFGRFVDIDKIIIFLRADFPHDNWWEKMTISFSDGTSIIADTVKTHQGQAVTFPKKTVSWLKLSNLIKADDPSPFPALTQVEVYGTESHS